MIGNNSLFKATRAAFIALSLLVCAPPAPFARAGQQGRAETPKPAEHYSCPMHASVKSETLGKCSKCGMALRKVSEDSEADTADAAPMKGETPTPSHIEFPDVELLDQDGRKVRFYSDLVKGKVVAINFIFTTCTTICPPLGATFARVQKDLGERTGRDVHFISISVDPATDTPERLKAWGAKFKAGAGWTFITGEKQHMDELLRALSASTASREDHSPTVLIGNDARGQWTRTYGLAKPSQLVKIINDAVEGRLEATGKGATP